MWLTVLSLVLQSQHLLSPLAFWILAFRVFILSACSCAARTGPSVSSFRYLFWNHFQVCSLSSLFFMSFRYCPCNAFPSNCQRGFQSFFKKYFIYHAPLLNSGSHRWFPDTSFKLVVGELILVSQLCCNLTEAWKFINSSLLIKLFVDCSISFDDGLFWIGPWVCIDEDCAHRTVQTLLGLALLWNNLYLQP